MYPNTNANYNFCQTPNDNTTQHPPQNYLSLQHSWSPVLELTQMSNIFDFDNPRDIPQDDLTLQIFKLELCFFFF